MKSTAIKITTGVIGGLLIVALVVVAALAIAGVFNVAGNTDFAAAEGDARVSEQHMIRGFDANTVLYIQSVDGSEPNGTADTFVQVIDNEYASVKMDWVSTRDENGNKGVKPVNGWKAGMFYSVSLASGYKFVNEEYKDYDSFMCVVAARESTEADTKVKENVIYLEKGKFEAPRIDIDETKYTLTVQGAAPTGENLVFVYVDGTKSKAYRQVAGMGRIVDNGGSYTLTVEDADVDDVYDSLYINKSYEMQEGDIQFDLAATEASIRNSDWFLAAVQYLYGEQLADGTNANDKKIDVKFDPSFSPGSPSVVTLNITITFKVFDEGDGSIVVKIANTFTPVFDVHIQDNDDGKAFDVNLDLDVETKATLEAKYAKSWSSLGEESNKLTDIANGLAALVNKISSGKLGNADNSAKGYTFAKWIIPIGTLPICIEDSLGFELGASFAGEVGAVATNQFHATIGVVYAGGELRSYHNVDDTFHFDNVTMAGSAEAKVGLFNEVGISAYGTISVDLGVHAGVYADVAGRLTMSGDDIVALFKNEKAFNIVPAYYFETGVYLDIDAEGKVFGFSIKKFNLLNKKFPLYTAGHKYLPMSFVETEEDETIYMQSGYFYLVGWDVNALDIQKVNGAESAMNLTWSEFDYEVGDNLRIEGNVVYAKTVDEFESYITVTSKVNKQLSKTIKVVKNPEAPTTTKAEQIFDRKAPYDCIWTVMLNSSKLLGVSFDGKALTDDQYSYANGTLRIKQGVFGTESTVAYGAHSVVVESSKGYLKLVARVINSAPVTVDDSTVIFDKNAADATAWSMELQGNDIVSLYEGAAVVDAKYYSYRAIAKQFVILKSYWEGKACGSYTESLTLSNGEVYNLNVVVIDSRAAKLNTKVYEYALGSNTALTLDVELYENAANTISAVSFNDSNQTTDVAVLPAAMFASIDAVGSYDGTVTVARQSLSFTVNVVNAQSSLVVPVKKLAFAKSSDKDVVFQAKIPANANLTIAECGTSDYSIGDASITIKASFLKAQKGTEWKGTVSGAGNSVVLTVSLINDVLPAITGGTTLPTKGEAVQVTWNLQEIAADSIVVEGLAEGQYSKPNAGGMTINASSLPYGNTVVTIYTPVNTLSVTVVRTGDPSISNTCTISKDAKCEAVFALDVAHLEFEYVKVDGKDILPSYYRYNDGKLYLANEYVYNLASGSYSVEVYLSDNTKLSATLNVNGEIPVDKPVGAGISSSPYLIYTAEQLAAVSKHVKDVDNAACYVLMADINMNGYTFSPIGDEDKPYLGIFDGNGYSISNLTVTEPAKYGKDSFVIGMFGYIGKTNVHTGTVIDLRLLDASVSFAKSGSVSAGIIAGRSAGTISNVTVLGGSISAESKSWLDIKNAYFDLGAVVGYCESGIINNVTVAATIEGKVKGLNVAGIQIGGRKSSINVGGVVGFFTSTEDKKNIRNVQVTASISCQADSNTINQNGWYGDSDLTAEEAAACVKRVRCIG